MENARTRVAAALNWDGEVILTSGASEAISLGLRGTEALASSVEHDAVLAVAGSERLPVTDDGYVNLNAISWNARFAVQSVNNETGVIQPMSDIAEAVREGALLRVRPKAMTVAVILAGLFPILVGHGAGSEVMSRIAAPMIGGMLTAPLLSMLVIPAAYLLLRRRRSPPTASTQGDSL